MSDVHVSVRSNLDALSAERLHRALVDMIRDLVREMVLFAQGIAPKRTGLLAEHIKSEEAAEVADMVMAKMGVTAVEEADERRSSGRYRRSQYPLFPDGGTHSPIFPAKAAAMWNPSEGIFGRTSVRGQHAQHFMLKTFEQARMILRADEQISLALKEMAARAAAERAGMELT